MIRIIQSEFFRIRKSRLFLACLLLSAFYVVSLALTFHYDCVKVPEKAGVQVIASLNAYTEFLFSDYSLIYPLTLFLGFYLTEDFHKGVQAVLLSKGVPRTGLFWGKLIAAWLGTLLYLFINFFVAYALILSMWAGRPVIEYALPRIGGYLLLQILCFFGYTCLIWLLSCLFRHRVIVTGGSFALLIVLYLYLTRISSALDLSDSLYQYWVVGLSNELKIGQSLQHLYPAILTILAYLLVPTAIAYVLYRRMDLRKLERR